MKYKILKSIALLSLATTGVSFAQQDESELESGIYHQNLDGLNKPTELNAADQITEKGLGTGFYYLFLGASGASATDSGLDYSYAGGGCMQQDGNGAFNGDFDMNFQLPDGHQIRGFRYYWYDNSANSSSATMFAADGAGAFTLLGNIISTGDTGYDDFYLDLLADNIIVNNFSNYYYIRFQSNEDGADQRLCGVRLFIDSDPA